MLRMNRFELRAIREAEFPTAFWAATVAFGEDMEPNDMPFARAAFELERSICAFEKGGLVGTSSVASVDLTIPGGGRLPAGGLTWVTVLPTHRRLGVLRGMMAAQLEAMTARGDAVSVLLASEGGIYGRFGYGPATFVAGFEIERAKARFFHPTGRPGHPGRIVLLEPKTAATTLPVVFDELRALRPGEVGRTKGWWEEYFYDPAHHREGAGGMFHAVHENADGVADGYVSYRIKDEWSAGDPAATLKVVELFAADEGVYASLWRYLLGMDLVRTVGFSRGRVDEPAALDALGPPGTRDGQPGGLPLGQAARRPKGLVGARIRVRRRVGDRGARPLPAREGPSLQTDRCIRRFGRPMHLIPRPARSAHGGRGSGLRLSRRGPFLSPRRFRPREGASARSGREGGPHVRDLRGPLLHDDVLDWSCSQDG